ncbi:hypothetical protein UMM65_06210 [Aureibaculum sp. 2210JD6-5]|uniref:OB-fold protein n=1 Tax=Aureibaculum sp. 2210JD6-5 TaxID=3103957 RepID=UPI002AAD4D2F|nr:hypothetical protein [Aureibaculum sp. 2210JD6-5]MDY7394827.1 hypothetical protein [Aureibaculum sp. 2210JD6-5]
MKRKTVFIISMLIIVIGAFTYNYIYKEHRNIGNEKAVLFGTALKVYSDFNQNSIEFNENYLDKTVEIEGEITETEAASVVLNHKVYVLFTDSLNHQISTNKKIIIKGRYVGFDDLLEVLKIDQATVVDNRN